MVGSLKSMVGIVVIPSSSFRSHCSCWTSGTGWLPPSSAVCASPRTSPCLGSQSFGLLCLLLALLLSCLPLALLICLLMALLFCLLMALLFSVLFIIAPDLRVFLAVLVPFTALLYSSRHWLFGCGFVCASFSESLCGRLRLRGSFLASLQHHYSALRPS